MLPAATAAVASADFNKDGRPDLALSDGSIWLNNGAGGLPRKIMAAQNTHP